jgi:uncharacterized protein YeaO (DUF488 family)
MTVRRFQIGNTRAHGEGLRVGVVRYPPRGVQKSDYAAEDYFDVWLPMLAPSRDLLKSRKGKDGCDLRYWHSFFSRYESEMRHSTDARQAIFLLAKLARRTPVSIGCTCGPNSHCHVRVLERLIQEAAASDGEGVGKKVTVCSPASERLTALSVYTIADPKTLSALNGKRGIHPLSSGRLWVGARELLHEALLTKQRVPIIFGDATECSRIIYAGVLDDVTVNDDDTEYLVSRIRPVKGDRRPQGLTLESTGLRIKPGFIKTYAICRTPDFLSARKLGL